MCESPPLTQSQGQGTLSSVFGVKYRTSPVSALYLEGRKQDIALQKARGSVDERNQLRLWLTPLTFEGKEVWVGQISRDIGVRLSSKTITTHKIDPDVDEGRDYLVQDLLLSGNLAGIGYVQGVGAATPADPRYNYTLDPYFTDGLRVTLFVSEDYLSPDDLELVPWEWPIPTAAQTQP
jgi:LssY C-terminus